MDQNKLILLVDDDEELVELLEELLQEEGFSVLKAFSGNEALKVFEENKGLIDIVLSDVRMPDGDGILLLKSIRQQSKELPYVVLHTGYSEITRSEAIKLGAVNLIQKPAGFTDLVDYLSTLK